MARAMCLLACMFAMLASFASAHVVKHTFHVGNLTVQPLCQERTIVAVNGKLPGPTIRVHEGDTLVVNVINESPYNLTIHWHGIFQLRTGWADGPSYVTQCPILPGNNYTYKFNITGQRGTLWWHAHFSWLRATVYGALFIRPKLGFSYPFVKPSKELPVILGEWYDANVIDVINQATNTGTGPNISDAYTINGRPGDLYSCSNKTDTYKYTVKYGKTYLLRIINAALNSEMFFKVAGHNLTVVAIDASYTAPYNTDVVVVAPGQTTDVILHANATPGAYYIAASPYQSANISIDTSTTTAILQYKDASSANPILPVMPALNDTPTAHRFYTNLTCLGNKRYDNRTAPRQADVSMFVTVGLGLEPCPPGASNSSCQGPNGTRLAASMNNASFALPTTLSLLQAHYSGVQGIYTRDFPDTPPLVFNYTDADASAAVEMTEKSTRVRRLAFNSTVEMVLQNTAILAAENHPMHLHGHNFFVLAQGFGIFNNATDRSQFNFVNPQIRNTIAVPVGGWAVIRFRANNPGVWIMHCHLDTHLGWGLATAFETDNGPDESSTLLPPPADLPRC